MKATGHAMKTILNILVFLVAAAGWGAAARADVVVWQDADTGLSLSWPDTWEIVNAADPDDIVTLAAPGRGDDAVCRVRARTDRRYMIYPSRYAWAVQRVAYSKAFWYDYLEGEYRDATIRDFGEPAGIGRGFASYALADFIQPGPGRDTLRRGLMTASLYHDTAYIVDCSALAGAYARWAPMFRSIMKSVDFKKAIHEVPSGHYRNFLQDEEWLPPRVDP